MTLTFSELITLLQRLTNTQSATTASYPLLAKTVDINNALDNFFLLARKGEGRAQVDDTRHTKYPVVKFSLVSGQQDYSFTNDEDGNQILDVYKVRVKDSAGNWHTLKQRDLQDGNDDELDSTTETTSPSKYDITANGIFLTDIPNYSSLLGGELYVSVSPVYFASTNTTQVAGIPGFFHRYLALHPAYFYSVQKNLPMKTDYYRELYGLDGKSGLESAITDYYSLRNKDEKKRMQVRQQNNR